MKFDSILFDGKDDIQLFQYFSVSSDIQKLLGDVMSQEEINKVLYENGYNKLFRKEV